VKSSVEQELAGGNAKPDTQGPTATAAKAAPVQRLGANPGVASNKQVKYICDLARERGFTLAELNAKVLERYGAETIYGLSKADASQLVEQLRMAQKKAA
jgi:hypothetical protein